MISVFDKKQDCCGCTACQQICPSNAIEMKPDEEGFLYPVVDQGVCTDCGLCRKICAFQNGYDTSDNFTTPYVYAVKHKNEDLRMTSSSGGAFTAMSDYILDNNGFVCGVAFDQNMNAVHQIASTKEERDRFKGSKYVQSNLANIFSEIRKLLEQKETVLFTGTPCQTAGLRSYLGDYETEKLFLCDIVCHGTPSPLMWKEHLASLEKRKNSKIVQYYCRSKVKGWHRHTEMVVYENGKKDYKSLSSQKHKILFYSHVILRPSCHQCRYTNFNRPSDITIADFWGIEKCMPNFDDNKGVSLVLINTSKGQKLFESVKENLICRGSNIRDCLQPHLQYPAKPSKMRELFWEDYRLKGYEYIIKKYAGYNYRKKLMYLVKEILSKIRVLYFFTNIKRHYITRHQNNISSKKR